MPNEASSQRNHSSALSETKIVRRLPKHMNNEEDSRGTLLKDALLGATSNAEGQSRDALGPCLPDQVAPSFAAVVDLRKRKDVHGLKMIEALSDQRLDAPNDLEVVFVVPNHTTAFGVAEEWKANPLIHTRYVIGEHQESIAEIAIREASADWYLFPNADDKVAPGYFKNLKRFFADPVSQRSPLVATKLMLHRGAGGWKQSWQKFKFVKNTALNLNRTTYVAQAHAASTLFSSTAIRALPGVELQDSNMTLHRIIGMLLLRQSTPMLGIAPRAVYRAFGESDFAENEVATVSHIHHATNFKNTYVHLFNLIPAGQPIPEWLGTMFLYELAFLLKREPRLKTRLAGLSGEEHRNLLKVIKACLNRIPESWIMSLRFPTVSVEARNMLVAMKSDGTTTKTFPAGKVRIARVDQAQEVVLVRYFYSGPLPDEKIWVGGRTVDAVAAKTKSVPLLKQVEYFERLLWIPASSWIQIELDGVRQEVVMRAFNNPDYQVTLGAIRNEFVPGPLKPEIPREPETDAVVEETSDELPRDHVKSPVVRKSADSSERSADKRDHSVLTRLLDFVMRNSKARENKSQDTNAAKSHSVSNSRPNRRSGRKHTQEYAYCDASVRKYGNAWVLMDRVNMAQDNAEHLYRYIQRNYPEINAWYVLDSNSADWPRLQRDGFRLIEFGSIDHAAVYMNASHVISSHLSPEVVSPIPIDYYQNRIRPWKTTFLQHGVTKDDMSHWLNQRTIDTLVTATQAEYDSFVEDFSPYVVTTKEVVLTGFPRHDALREKRRRCANDDSIDTILVAPTWRDSLLKPKSALGVGRELVEDFADTQYARDWGGLLTDVGLLGAVKAAGYRIVLLPHPNMQDAVDEFAMDPSVQIVRYEDGDIQELLARTRLLVTDYSSLAFETALIDTPVVYFQSDRRLVFSGKHTYSPGYYDYVSDGFGPIADKVSDAASHAVTLLNQIDALDGAVPEPYAGRIRSTFKMRDQSSCDLVYEAIKRSERALTAFPSRGHSKLAVARDAVSG